MNSNQDSLHTLTEIRDLMDRSSKFLSLSGLTGVFAGIFALLGALSAYVRFKTDWITQLLEPQQPYVSGSREEVITFLLLDGTLVLIASLGIGIWLTVRKARRNGLTVWNSSSRRLLASLIIPLVTGGVFCLAMLHYGYIWLVFPATLIFYGLAIVSGSRFTYPEVFSLGVSEIVLGCIALFFTGYSLLFWSVGFGILHIVYGLAMYNRYDRALPSASMKGTARCLTLTILAIGASTTTQAQVSDYTKAKSWYDKETIYLQGGNSYVKNNMVYSGRKALQNEFRISEGGMELYVKSRRMKNIGIVFSILGSAGSIYSLASGNREHFRKFFWISLGTGLASSLLTVGSGNLRNQAVWLRNRDALLLLEANQ